MNLRIVLSLFFVIIFTACACFAQQSGVKASKVVRLRGNVLAVEDSDRVKIAADDGRKPINLLYPTSSFIAFNVR